MTAIVNQRGLTISLTSQCCHVIIPHRQQNSWAWLIICRLV